MIQFYPTWRTPAGALEGIAENTNVTRTLVAVRAGTTIGEGDTLVTLDVPFADITAVTIDGASTTYESWTSSLLRLPGLIPTSAVVSVTTADGAHVQSGARFTIIHMGDDASKVTKVLRSAQVATFYAQSGNIILTGSTKPSDLIEMETGEAIVFTMLHSNLPPGLELGTNGAITGQVGRLPSNGETVTYSFGVRISDGHVVRDRQFFIDATPTKIAEQPPGWGSLFPPPQIKDPEGFIYYDLGRTTRGSPFTYEIDIFQPGGVPPKLIVEPLIEFPDIQPPFNNIPPGLTVNESTGLMTGAATTTTPLGEYFFRLRMLDNRGDPIVKGSGLLPKTFMLHVAAPDATRKPLRFIHWVTPAGLLGSFDEGQAMPLGLRATCTSGEPVTYELAENTPLPPGITLHPERGDLEGVFLHVPRNRVYEFTVRARVGDSFQDRTFSVGVRSRYSRAGTASVAFHLRLEDTAPAAAYYNTGVIQDAELFRPLDPNFGNVSTSNKTAIYLISGLNSNADALESIVRGTNIGGPISLMLGPHKIGYAKLDGKVIYEVLYRDVWDPLARAGGFKLVNGLPVADPLLYPQSSPAEPRYIHPSSINNIRYEFATKVGFAANDPTMRFIPGPSGVENLPLWMISPQVGNDPKTMIGFKPMVVIAYLKPGSGRNVLDRIAVRTRKDPQPRDPSDPLNEGHEVRFDQFFMNFERVTNPTQFGVNLPDAYRDIARYFSNTTVVDGRYRDEFYEDVANSLANTVDIANNIHVGDALYYPPKLRENIIQLEPDAPDTIIEFDSGDTIFDEFSYWEGKYYRINPFKPGSPT